MRFVLFLFILISTLEIRAQTPNTKEQLTAQLLTERDKLVRASIYNQLCTEYWHLNTDSASIFADSAYNNVAHLPTSPTKIDAYRNIGIAQYTKGNYDSALELYNHCIDLSTSINAPHTEITHLIMTCYKRQGNLYKAIEYGEKLFDSMAYDDDDFFPLVLSLTECYTETGEVLKAKNHRDLLYNNPEILKIPEYAGNFQLLKADINILEEDYLKAIENIEAGREIFANNAEPLEIAKSQTKLAIVHSLLGNYELGRDLLRNNLEIYKESPYSFGLAQTYKELGKIYVETGSFEISADYFFKALYIYTEQNNLLEKSDTYQSIGWIYYLKGVYYKAEEYILKSIEITKRIGGQRSEAANYHNLGMIKLKMEQYDSAVALMSQAIEIREELNLASEMSKSYFRLGSIYDAQNKKDLALIYYLRALNIQTETGNKLDLAITENALGAYYSKTGMYARAEQYFNNARQQLMAMQLKKYLLDNYILTAQHYKRNNQPKLSNDFYQSYFLLQDSLDHILHGVQILEMESKYEILAKEKEIELLQLENRGKERNLSLKEATISSQKQMILIISVVVALILFLLFTTTRLLKHKNRNNKKLIGLNKKIIDQKEELQAQADDISKAYAQITLLNESLESEVQKQTGEIIEQGKELDTFFYRLSHDFRGPIATFQGLAQLAHALTKDPQILQLFDKVDSTATYMNSLIKKLEIVSLIASESVAEYTVDWSNILATIQLKYKTLIQEKNIQIKEKTTLSQPIKSNAALLTICLEKVIENAIYFSKEGADSYIEIRIQDNEKTFTIEIEDNGQGIPPDHHPHIFEMFYRANEFSKGNGLGLYLVSKATQKLNGSVSFTSSLDHGTHFVFEFPMH